MDEEPFPKRDLPPSYLKGLLKNIEVSTLKVQKKTSRYPLLECSDVGNAEIDHLWKNYLSTPEKFRHLLDINVVLQ